MGGRLYLLMSTRGANFLQKWISNKVPNTVGATRKKSPEIRGDIGSSSFSFPSCRDRPLWGSGLFAS